MKLFSSLKYPSFKKEKEYFALSGGPYFYSQNLKWVKTKHNKAYHLTWDLYNEDHPYYQFKIQNLGLIWNHTNLSSYSKITI